MPVIEPSHNTRKAFAFRMPQQNKHALTVGVGAIPGEYAHGEAMYADLTHVEAVRFVAEALRSLGRDDLARRLEGESPGVAAALDRVFDRAGK